MTTRLLVTGAGGFVGRALCEAAAAAGHKVVAAVRRPESAPPGTRVRTVPDVGPDTDWTTALEGVETVIHLAARVHVMRERAADPDAAFHRINVAGTRRLAQAAAAGGVRRFVLISSVKAMGEATPLDQPFTEADRAAPVDAYGRSKLAAEQALAEVAAATGLETAVVRPPLVYGPGVGGNFRSLLAWVDRGIPLPLGALRNARSLVYVGNLADALLQCAVHPAAVGGTFLVRDGEDLSTPALIRRVSAALDRPVRLVPVPAAMLRLAAKVAGKSAAFERLAGSLVVDDGALRRQLGWNPPFDVVQGIEATTAWWRAA